MRLALVAAMLCLAGCADKGPPQIETHDVNIAVPVPCTVDPSKQRPDLMDLPRLRGSLDTAPNSDSKAQIVTGQLLAYMGWVPVLEAAVAGCHAAPATTPR